MNGNASIHLNFIGVPWGDDIQNMPVIEIHHLTREDVENMIGVEGYDEASVRSLLVDFGAGGMNWLDEEQQEYEDATSIDMDEASSDVVAAIQFGILFLVIYCLTGVYLKKKFLIHKNLILVKYG